MQLIIKSSTLRLGSVPVISATIPRAFRTLQENVMASWYKSQAKTPQGLEPRPGNQECQPPASFAFFFFKARERPKSKTWENKRLFSQEKKNLYNPTDESASTKMLAWPSLLCPPEKVLAENFCNPTPTTSYKGLLFIRLPTFPPSTGIKHTIPILVCLLCIGAMYKTS